MCQKICIWSLGQTHSDLFGAAALYSVDTWWQQQHDLKKNGRFFPPNIGIGTLKINTEEKINWLHLKKNGRKVHKQTRSARECVRRKEPQKPFISVALEGWNVFFLSCALNSGLHMNVLAFNVDGIEWNGKYRANRRLTDRKQMVHLSTL